jgi:hypothetical protein
MKILLCEGGFGRQVFSTALIPKLAGKDKIYCMSSYTEVYQDNPYVAESFGRNSTYIYKSIIKDPNNTILFRDPYFESEFIQGKIHVINAWANALGIEYTKDMLPELYVNKTHLNKAKEFKQQVGNFIIVQFTCGQSPLSQNFNAPFNYEGFERKVSKENAQKIVNAIKDKYPSLTILNMCFPNENMQLDGVVTVGQVPTMFYAAALKESEGFIGVNSCLMHMAAAMRTKGVGLWGGSSPTMWGYDFHTHVSGKCTKSDLYCTRPYLRELGDFVGNGQKWTCPDPTCMDIDAKEVVTAVSDILSPSVKTIVSEKSKAPVPVEEKCPSKCTTI